MNDLPKRLRHHVESRGGMYKTADGEPMLPNGAWAMMLKAADRIEQLEYQYKKMIRKYTKKIKEE